MIDMPHSDSSHNQAPEISEEFFAALAKVRSIHSNCKVLLKTHHQRAGLEIMDAMSAHQEAAYERLCRYLLQWPHGPTSDKALCNQNWIV